MFLEAAFARWVLGPCNAALSLYFPPPGRSSQNRTVLTGVAAKSSSIYWVEL